MNDGLNRLNMDASCHIGMEGAALNHVARRWACFAQESPVCRLLQLRILVRTRPNLYGRRPRRARFARLTTEQDLETRRSLGTAGRVGRGGKDRGSPGVLRNNT